jgi:hypothetical protein
MYRWLVSFWLLTRSTAPILIPLSKRRVTILPWPSKAAMCSAVCPRYNRDTDRKMQISRIRTGRQVGYAKDT